MLILSPKQCYDLNKFGIHASLVIAVLLLFFPFDIWIKLLLEICLFLYVYILYKKIIQNKQISVLITNDNNWFVQHQDYKTAVELKDYWLLKGQIFIWLKASKKSISFVVSRSIIGANKFSQLRAKVK